MNPIRAVPQELKNWFIVHAIVDYIIGIPLFINPNFLTFFGSTTVDPLATRIVTAAFFAIGGISFLARNASRETYKIMLKMKLVWSGAAILAAALTWAQGFKTVATLITGLTFCAFFLLWAYFAKKLADK